MLLTYISCDNNIIKLKIRAEKDRVFNSKGTYVWQYREEDEHFYETNGILMLLAYLKPILNSTAYIVY